MIDFGKDYYSKIMKRNHYDPFAYGYFDFSLGSMCREELQLRFLCHHNADRFAQALPDKSKTKIVTTGFGLSGIPHMGTVSQLVRCKRLSEAGIKVQIVLGDLDAYNGKNIPLSLVRELAEKYQNFMVKFGLGKNKVIVRNQFEALEVLRVAYLIGKYMDETMFDKAEEDLHDLYAAKGKVDQEMSFRRRLSLDLMVADFVSIGQKHNDVLVLLGIDEHQYVKFAQQVVQKIREDTQAPLQPFDLGAIYTLMIKGFNGYPKMSKSFPESSINLSSSADDVQNKIMNGEGPSSCPEDNVVFQTMTAVGQYSLEELKNIYFICLQKGPKWKKLKRTFAEYVVYLCELWSN